MKSLHRIDGNPYYICAPDWTHISAGVRAVHYLCHALNGMGEEAYLAMATEIAPHLRTPRLTQDVADWHILSQGRTPIVVYPEIIKGNPLNGAKVVRWLLNKPGFIHKDGDTTFPETDQIFYYNKMFLPKGMRGEHLFVPCVDPDEMPAADSDVERPLECVYGLRYRHAGHEYHPSHQGLMDLSDRIRSREEISDVLRRSSVLYAYEPSAITTDAVLSGCPVVWVVNPYMPFDPIETDDTLLGYGQCSTRIGEEVSPSVLKKARQTLIYVRPQWEIRAVITARKTLDAFVKITQKK